MSIGRIALYLGAAIAVYIAIIHPWAVSLRRKKSPAYDAKCTVREDARYARGVARRQQQRAAQQQRALEWAKANPDDPTAKALLASNPPVPATSATSTTSAPVLTIEVDPEDPTALLRADQQSADEWAARRRELEEKNIQLLELAIRYPDRPESQRHLTEKLAELQKWLPLTRDAKKVEAEATIARIQAALDSVNTPSA
jgi:hypothetical protein